MKKKFLFFTTLIIFVFVLSACIVGGGDKTAEENKEVEKEESGVIQNIKDALTKGRKMECTTKVSANGVEFESKSYVHGEKFKSISEVEGSKFYTLFDGDYFYNWGDALPQGTKMSEECLKEIEELSKDLAEGSEVVEGDQYQSSEELFEEGVDVSCKSVLSIDFSVPSDVNFVDQCETMKKMIESVKKLQESMKGFNLPNMNQ